MSDSNSKGRIVALSICLLFVGIPILGIISADLSQTELQNENKKSLTHVDSAIIHEPGSAHGQVFSNSVFELNSYSPKLIMGNGSSVEFSSASAVWTDDSVISTAGDCSLLANFTLQCDGLNNYGQLGIGNTQQSSGYVNFGGKIPAALSDGSDHYCVILDDGSVNCWGRNNKGQIGDGTNINRNSPVAIDLGTNKTAVSISAGRDFTCALLNTGEVSCWGDNSYGIFADGTTTDSNSPMVSNHSTGLNAVAITTPGYSVCAIFDNASISCWGKSYTVFSVNGAVSAGSVQIALASGRTAVAIDGINSHTCAILDNGSANCWGVNTYGQFGNGECSSVIVGSGCTGSNGNMPIEVNMTGAGSISSLIAISVGTDSTCGINAGNDLYCWGRQSGEFDGTNDSLTMPHLMNFSDGSSIAYSDQDMDNDGTVNILDVHMSGDADGDGIPSPTDPYPNNPARWMNCEEGEWGRLTCTEASLGHYAPNGALYHTECSVGEFQHTSGQPSCNSASAGHYVNQVASNIQYQCERGSYQTDVGQSSCTNATAGNHVPFSSGESGDDAGNSTHLSSMSADYSATIATDSDLFDYYKITVPKSSGISVNLSTFTSAEVDLILYNSSLGVIASSNNSGFYDDVNTNATSYSSAFDVYIAVERVNGTGAYSFKIWLFKTADGTLIGDPTYSLNVEFSARQIECSTGTYQPNAGSHSCDLADPGYHVAGVGATSQTACSAGTYQPQYGQISCVTASLGHFVPATASSYQTPANAGYYVALLGATSETPCNAGTYQPLTGQYFCNDADAGYYVESSGSDAQLACGLGTYQPNTGETYCLNAAAGYHVPTTAATSQTACGPGTYQPSGGQSNCLYASPGFFSAGNASTTQTPCVAGTFQPTTGQTRCLNADAGYYVDTNASATQFACGLGTYQPNTGSIDCMIAEPGHYVGVTGSPSQTPCAAGTYNPNSGSTSFSDCIAASTGHYVPNSGSDAELECGIGTYTDQTGQSTCTDADAGNYVDSTAAESQTECAAGTYQPQAAQAGCYDAEPGNFVPSPGSTLQTECSVGTYNPMSGSSLSGDCLQAMAGYYVANSGSAGQTECGVGTYQPVIGQSSCIDSPAGTYISTTGQTGYIECPVGRYQPAQGATECVNSEPGNYVASLMATAQIECISGTYQPDFQATDCIEADAGYYVASDGSASQTINPLDYYTDSNGSSYLTNCPNFYITLELGADSITDCVLDTDGDRTIDEIDPDDDGDGRLDLIDDCSPGLTGWISNVETDADGDGCQDEGEDSDDDNDGVEDTDDSFPQNNLEWEDTDGDGLGNNEDPDDDGDGWSDATEEICDTDSELIGEVPLDTDEDGICDKSDTDDDNDGYPDISDWAKLDAMEWVDTDGDGIGNNADTDDDDDGWSDEKEILEGTNPLWGDSDNDGVLDPEDTFPNDIHETLDDDGDGVGNNQDSHPNNARYQTTFDLLIDIMAGIAALVVIGAAAVFGLRQKSEDSEEEDPTPESQGHVGVGIGELEPMEVAGVSTISDSATESGFSDADVASEADPILQYTQEPVAEPEPEPEPEPTREFDVGSMEGLDDLLSELPAPPKLVIAPPAGTPINANGQQVWKDETGQVWCMNMDGTILKHDAATGGWITYHN